jgi:glycosyltransferase involved in cell wall biosynthesis
MKQTPTPVGRRPTMLFILNDAPFFVTHRLSLALAARDAGVSVHVAVAHDDRAAETIRAAGFRHHDIPLRRGSRGPLGEARLVLALAKVIRMVRPDLIHAVTMKPVLYGGALARLLRVPGIVNAVTGLGYLFIIDGALAWLQRAVIMRLYWFALGHRNGRTIFQNPDDRDLFVSRRLVDPATTVIVRGTGVDTERFAVVPEPSGPPVVMFPARVIGDKGIHEFIAAARILRPRFPEARFAIVGRTDPDNPTDVGEAAIRGWEREGVADWWGFSDDMADTLPRAHIVCLPSYREGLPRVLIEAAACGRPLIAADVPGCREIVRDGRNGLLVPARDGAATAEAIARLLDDPDLRRRMGAAARAMAVDGYRVDRFVADTFAVYRSVSADWPGPNGTRA